MAAEPLPSVVVTGEGARAARGGALMVYRKWVKPVGGRIEAGQLVVAEDEEGRILGCGLYDTVGPVALRMLQLGRCKYASVEEAISSLIERAYKLRRRLGYATDPESGYRLVNSDGDYMPGLIVDVYAELAVVQSSSVVWDKHMKAVVDALSDIVGVTSVYEKSTQRTRRDIGLEPREKLWLGEKTTAIIREGDAVFFVDARHGQKTGFFLDQRENRLDFSSYSQGDVLDLFAYTGGFGIQALVSGNAERATFVEEDDKALKILQKNLELNKVTEKAKVKKGNVWEVLSKIVSRREKFASVVVDPPAFIPEPKAKHRGMQAYEKLYANALRTAGRDSIVFVSSCSAHLERKEFASIVSRAASRAGVEFSALGGMKGVPPDHATRPAALHLDYLKALFLHVF
jgi:23S rRNA (cytosine1962-C5)-methyltransferase